MNRKGFTLVELLAVLVALGLVLGIGAFSISSIVTRSKEKSEDAFVETIKDAMDVYISSPDKPTVFSNKCKKTMTRDDGTTYTAVYEWTDNKSIYSVVNSGYKPINKNQLVNPANNKKCFKDDEIDSNTNEVIDSLTKIEVIIYRMSRLNDDNTLTTLSYFYKIDKKQDSFAGCFNNFYTIDEDGNKIDTSYISNLEAPEKDICS